MNIPSNLKYTKDHEWVLIEGDEATVGITDFAQKELGDIVYVEVETLDQTLDKDEVFGTVEAVKTVSDLFLPLSGEIIEFNDDRLHFCFNRTAFTINYRVAIRFFLVFSVINFL